MKHLFNGKDYRMCIDQYGAVIWARTIKELRSKTSQLGHCPKARAMCVDKVAGKHAGKSVQVGYVIGHRWFSVYQPLEVEC